MKNIAFLLLLTTIGFATVSLNRLVPQVDSEVQKEYPKSLADYDDFKNLVNEVEKIRAEHLIDLNTFIKMSEEENVVILDTRSDLRYKRKHVKGAIHLDFTDFTQTNLLELIPDSNTKILIYCNNNFMGDQIDLASKVAGIDNSPRGDNFSDKKNIMLALNIPTYINLYGYGYQNIYELDELVNVNDLRIEFEGTEIQ